LKWYETWNLLSTNPGYTEAKLRNVIEGPDEGRTTAGRMGDPYTGMVLGQTRGSAFILPNQRFFVPTIRPVPVRCGGHGAVSVLIGGVRRAR
jgi:hypothetical protein